MNETQNREHPTVDLHVVRIHLSTQPRATPTAAISTAARPFEDIPNDWFCPVCGARKRDFEIYEP